MMLFSKSDFLENNISVKAISPKPLPMIKVLLPLGLLFFFVGFILIKSILGLGSSNLPIIHEQAGTITKVDIYTTSKHGEVFYFELAGIKSRFWLKARMDSETRQRLAQEVLEGDQVTVFYTSLEGTRCDCLI